jgi:hypothetical protein
MANVDDQARTGAPAVVYAGKVEENRAALLSETKRDRGLGYGKLALLVLIFFGAIALVRAPERLLWLLIPAAIFAALGALHTRVLERMQRFNRVLAFYERGLERLNDAWVGNGETGERFLDPSHPYARDLDIFGKGSLFEMLCIARTRAGEETLARWLLEAAPLDVIRARQAAVAELREQVGFREQLFAAGDSVRVGVHPRWLAQWGETKPELGPAWLRPLMAVLGAAWLVSLVVWVGTSLWIPLVALTSVNLALERLIGGGVLPFVRETENAAVDLKILAGVLEVLEQGKFSSPLLCTLQSGLRAERSAPSAVIRKLGRIVSFIESRRNLIVRIVNRPTFYVAQAAMAAEAWRARYGASIRGWLSIAGEMEALAALSAYAYEHPATVFPEFVEQTPYFEAQDFTHPLLPESRAVRNDLQLDAGQRLMVISGPNMAGKSTFTRSVGVNALLAQAGAPVRARRMALSELQVAASICVLDSLQGGLSRFYAEITRLKQIYDLTGRDLPVLFLLDELLSGTNSHDRQVGTESIVRGLLRHRAVGIVTTHDLALTAIVDSLNGQAVNYHFGDTFAEGRLSFDYILSPGIAQSTNALQLMQSIGLTGE